MVQAILRKIDSLIDDRLSRFPIIFDGEMSVTDTDLMTVFCLHKVGAAILSKVSGAPLIGICRHDGWRYQDSSSERKPLQLICNSDLSRDAETYHEFLPEDFWYVPYTMPEGVSVETGCVGGYLNADTYASGDRVSCEAFLTDMGYKDLVPIKNLSDDELRRLCDELGAFDAWSSVYDECAPSGAQQLIRVRESALPESTVKSLFQTEFFGYSSTQHIQIGGDTYFISTNTDGDSYCMMGIQRRPFSFEVAFLLLKGGL